MGLAKKNTVFLVDDDAIYCQSLKKHLEDKFKGSDIHTYGTGEQCMQQMHSKPDLIVLDYYLNSITETARDGLTVLRQIKAKYPNTEVIMLTGEENTKTSVTSIKNGSFDYLVKNDNAFIRTSNLASKVFFNKKLRENSDKYRTSLFFVTVCMAVVTVSTVLIHLQHIITK